MRRRVRAVLLATAALPLAFLGVGACLPRKWTVEERIEIAASPEAIHEIVDDLRNFDDWYYWNHAADEERQIQRSAVSRGVGATIRWSARIMGDGALTITASEPHTGVWFEEAIESGATNAEGSLLLEATERGTTVVTWRDEGTVPAIYGGYFVRGIEQALARHVIAGLGRLKQRVESPTPR